MLRKIKFKNFYSFENEQEISFLVSKKKSYDYFQSKVKKDQISKVAGFIGSNASGKTNAMRVFGFLEHFICNEKRGEVSRTGLKTFFNDKKESSFYIEFELEEHLYFYEFTIKNHTIKKERLSEQKINKNSRKEVIFYRKNNTIDRLHKDYFKDFPTNYLKAIRTDVSLMAFLKAHYDIKIINKIFNFFTNIYCNINEAGELNTDIYSYKSIRAYLKDPSLKKEMEEFIQNFDLGLEGIEINEGEDELTIYGKHRNNENLKRIAFEYESRGTRSLFFMLAHLFKALKNNGIVVIDELETGLHPEAVNKIIDYFIDENEKGRAQLIFSSHSLGFLRKFDMQQIFLTNKNQSGRSTIYRLDSVEGVRTDENFLAKYLSGAYGSFPNIEI